MEEESHKNVATGTTGAPTKQPAATASPASDEGIIHEELSTSKETSSERSNSCSTTEETEKLLSSQPVHRKGSKKSTTALASTVQSNGSLRGSPHQDMIRDHDSYSTIDYDIYLEARRAAVQQVVREDEDDPSGEFLSPKADFTFKDCKPQVHRQESDVAVDDQQPAYWQEERLSNPLSKDPYPTQGTWTMESLESSQYVVSSSRDLSVQSPPETNDFGEERNTDSSLGALSRPGAIRVIPSLERGEDDEGYAERTGRRRSSVVSSVLRSVNGHSLIQAFVVDSERKDGRGNHDSSRVLAQAEPLDTRVQIVRCRVVACLFIVGLLGMLVSLSLTLTQRRRNRAPTVAPSLFPSASPSYSSVGILSFLSERSWDGGTGLSKPGSPQYEAAQWMLSHSGGELLASYSEDRVLQRYVMACIYFSLGGPTWLNNSNWVDMEVGECDWFLESANPCNEKQEVTDIVLRQNLLHGTIPPEFTLLPAIKVFDLSSNDITGLVPSQIGQMATIEALVLGANKLTGEVPKEFAFMPNLRLFDLSNNHLDCAQSWIVPINNKTLEPGDQSLISSDQANLGRNLVVIDNANNPGAAPPGYGCALPDVIGLFTNLRKVDLTGTPFVGTVPSLIGALVRLRRLALPNQFSMSGGVPTEVGGLRSLVNFDATSAFRLDTRRPVPSAIGFLTSLEELRAASIAFDGTIPTEVGLLSRKLRLLDFSNSSMRGKIPSQVGHLTALTELRLGGTALSGTLPSELGLMGDRLRYLDLHGITITSGEATKATTGTSTLGGVIPGHLASLSRLTHMDLSFTDVSGEWPTELNRRQLSSLQVLKLESTKVVGSITELVCSTSNESDAVLVVEDVRIGNTLLECACCPSNTAIQGSSSR